MGPTGLLPNSLVHHQSLTPSTWGQLSEFYLSTQPICNHLFKETPHSIPSFLTTLSKTFTCLPLFLFSSFSSCLNNKSFKCLKGYCSKSSMHVLVPFKCHSLISPVSEITYTFYPMCSFLIISFVINSQSTHILCIPTIYTSIPCYF